MRVESNRIIDYGKGFSSCAVGGVGGRGGVVRGGVQWQLGMAIGDSNGDGSSCWESWDSNYCWGMIGRS